MDYCVSCFEGSGHKLGCQKELKRLTNRLSHRKRQLKHAENRDDMKRITELNGSADDPASIANAERAIKTHVGFKQPTNTESGAVVA